MGKRVSGQPSVHRAPPPHVKKTGAPTGYKETIPKIAKVVMGKLGAGRPHEYGPPPRNSQKVANAARLNK